MTLRDYLPPSLVVKYYLYRGAKAASFTAAIWYLYIKAHTGTFASLGVIDAVWWGGLLVFEVPTGYIADRIGRKRALVIGTALVTVAQVAMGFANSFAHFVGIFVFWAFAGTFRTGTSSAWLYDALAAEIGEAEFARIKGRGSSAALVLSGVTAVVGGYIADVSMAYAWFATAGVNALAIPVILSFPTANGREGEDEDETLTIRDALPVMRERFTTPPLRTFVLYVGLFTGVVWAVNVFVQPVGASLGMGPDELGWLFGAFTAVGAVANYLTGHIKDYVGIRRWLVAVPLGLGALFGAVAVMPVLSIPVFVLMRGVRGTVSTLASQFLNDRIDSLGRATLLSTAGMAYRLVIIPTELGSGALADQVTVFTTMGVLGVLLVAGTALLLYVESPFGFPNPAEGATAPAGADVAESD